MTYHTKLYSYHQHIQNIADDAINALFVITNESPSDK